MLLSCRGEDYETFRIMTEIEAGRDIVKSIMVKTKEHDGAAGMAVIFMCTLNALLLECLPYRIMRVFIWIKAALNRVPFESVMLSWEIPRIYQAAAYYLIPAVVMVLLGFLECLIVVKSSWYRAAGCLLIIVYMIASWIMLFPARYSLGLLTTGNRIFMPVLLVYASVGCVRSFCVWTERINTEYAKQDGKSTKRRKKKKRKKK